MGLFGQSAEELALERAEEEEDGKWINLCNFYARGGWCDLSTNENSCAKGECILQKILRKNGTVHEQ
jgi:hypothetical protein